MIYNATRTVRFYLRPYRQTIFFPTNNQREKYHNYTWQQANKNLDKSHGTRFQENNSLASSHYSIKIPASDRNIAYFRKT